MEEEQQQQHQQGTLHEQQQGQQQQQQQQKKKNIMEQQQQQQQQQHLDWSNKQRRILTADGTAESLYCAERGFPFEETELPHYHLLSSSSSLSTRLVFSEWKRKQVQSTAVAVAAVSHSNETTGDETGGCSRTGDGVEKQQQQQQQLNSTLIVGAWNRPLFCGGWEHSTSQDECVYNLQTKSLFVDLRIPNSRRQWVRLIVDFHNIQSLNDLTATQLRYYARQHVFAGYSYLTKKSSSQSTTTTATTIPMTAAHTDPSFVAVCTRHHCIDWNFVGVGRSRPNKWWIQVPSPPQQQQQPLSVWKEWAFATDPAGQHYYMERWERRQVDDNELKQQPTGNDFDPNDTVILALRRKQVGDEKTRTRRDGVIVVVGNQFNFCIDRVAWPNNNSDDKSNHDNLYSDCSSLIDLVDTAILQHNDVETARRYLSMQGGHGCIIHNNNNSSNNNNKNNSCSWKIDCAIEFWREGTTLWDPEEEVTVVGSSLDECGGDCHIVWNEEEWDVVECCHLDTVEELRTFLWTGTRKRKQADDSR